MGAIERFNSPARVQRIGNDSVYGTGADGNTIIASNTSLSRDMYYNNLTVNTGTMLNTNGFRVFVKGTLTLNGNIGVGSADTANSGTVSGQTDLQSNTTISLGGNAYGNTYTVSTMSTNLLNDISTAILGYYIDSSSNTKVITGGAGGGTGISGTVTPGAAGTVTPGVAGTRTFGVAGSGATAGGAGSLVRNTGAPGGPGTSGTNGAAGSTPPAAAAGTISAAVAGSTPPAAAGGAGAKGGPLVIIVAKTFAGAGYILSQGKNGNAGAPSATGTGAGPAATSTNAGPAATGSGATNGAAGSATPAVPFTQYADGPVHYLNGDGVHGTSQHYPGPNLPHGSHIAASGYARLHGYTYRHVHRGADHARHSHRFGYHSGHSYGAHPSGGNYGHHYNDYTDSPDTATYYAINGVNHTYPHRAHTGRADSFTSGHHGSGNFYDRNSGTHGAHYGAVNDNPVGGYYSHGPYHTGGYPDVFIDWDSGAYHYPRNHQDINTGHWLYRQAGTVSHTNVIHAPGGSAGGAGTNGTNGSTTAGTQASTTAGTNGSTTAGGAGQSGGGGGIIIVTETTPIGIQTSVSGGSISGNTASSGTVVTVLNA